MDEDIPELIPAAPLDASHVPLTIICGFLGAGKSTLLKRILTERHGYRIAVIMNEFGDTADIEARAINVASPGEEQSEEFLELANGCLCCSIKDTGIAAIEKLMQRKGAFDHILLETTGLADPGPIASIFWHNEEFATGLGRDIALDGVVCVVDAVFGKEQMEEDHSTDGINIGESLRQIAGADVILLNKADLVTPDALNLTEDLIHQVNPAAPVFRTVKGEIDLKNIMGISAYTLPPIPQTTSKISAPIDEHVHSEECGHSHNPSTHYEVRGISSLQVSCPALSQKQYDRLDEWIRLVLWENRIPEEPTELQLKVLRCKGAFTLDTGATFVLQGVQSMYEIAQLEGAEVMGIPESGKIVLIGKGLNDVVRQSLESIFQ